MVNEYGFIEALCSCLKNNVDRIDELELKANIIKDGFDCIDHILNCTNDLYKDIFEESKIMKLFMYHVKDQGLKQYMQLQALIRQVNRIKYLKNIKKIKI